MKSYILSYSNGFGIFTEHFKTNKKIPFALRFQFYNDDFTDEQEDFLKSLGIILGSREWIQIQEIEEKDWKII
jgi:hypothetical protein